MTTSKTAYTVEQTTELVNAYSANPTAETVEQFAVKFGKSVKSIVAKLSREKVYIKKEYVTKNGEKAIKKDSVADQIGMLLDMTEPEIESLTKANKTALTKILNFVKVKVEKLNLDDLV
jgi:hypothetical protein